MTGAYLRVQRDGKWDSIEVEHLTSEERTHLLRDRDTEEMLRWLDLLCGALSDCQGRLKEIMLEAEGYVDGAPDRGPIANLANRITAICEDNP